MSVSFYFTLNWPNAIVWFFTKSHKTLMRYFVATHLFPQRKGRCHI